MKVKIIPDGAGGYEVVKDGELFELCDTHERAIATRNFLLNQKLEICDELCD